MAFKGLFSKKKNPGWNSLPQNESESLLNDDDRTHLRADFETQNTSNSNATSDTSNNTSNYKTKEGELSIKSIPISLTSNKPLEQPLLYYQKSALNVGQVKRYHVSFTPNPDSYSQDSATLWLKVKNLEIVALRAAYLAGPFILYVDVRPEHYSHTKKVESTADQPYYEPQLKAGQSFYAPLHIDFTRKQASYFWTIDVVSQIIFSLSAQVQFEIAIAHDKDSLHSSLINSALQQENRNRFNLNSPIFNRPAETGLSVTTFDTLDLWHSPVPKEGPVHLVIITHGLHSNTGADMLYLKEAIDKAAKQTGENVIVRGYFGNVRKTEKGVRYLGRRVAEYIVNEAAPAHPPLPQSPVKKISFIGHSLGGLVQTYAIAYIATHYPDFFERIEPINFITLASPYLGISNENPYYVKFALDLGFVGKSGQDLSLAKPLLPGQRKPLLRILPTGPTHVILKKFKARTLYANAINDGIVPLRTSAILYLDWQALSQIAIARKREQKDQPQQGQEAFKQEGKDTKQEPAADKQKEEKEADKKVQEDRKEEGFSSSDADKDHSSDDSVKEIPLKYDEMQPSTSMELSNASGDQEKDVFSKTGDLLASTVAAPVQNMLSFFAPSSMRKPTSKIYKHSQTRTQSPEEEDIDYKSGNLYNVTPQTESTNDSSESVSSNSTSKEPVTSHQGATKDSALPKSLQLPKKTGVLESGVSVLLPPLPPDSFILDPSTRGNEIVHDRVYHDYDLPPRRFKRRTSSLTPHGFRKKNKDKDDDLVERSKIEERMARDYHRDLSWRKVLVTLEPDAHNNIVVRRRFANAYGWPVIDHLVEEHFIKPILKEKNLESSSESSSQKDGVKSPGFGLNKNMITPLDILKGIPDPKKVSTETVRKEKESKEHVELESIKDHPTYSSTKSYEKEEDSFDDEEGISLVKANKQKNRIHYKNKSEETYQDTPSSPSGATNISTTSSFSSTASYTTSSSGNTESWEACLRPEKGMVIPGSTYNFDDDSSNSNNQPPNTWLKRTDSDSNDGLIFQMGNMFDNIREIGNLNFTGFAGSSVEKSTSTTAVSCTKTVTSQESELQAKTAIAGSPNTIINSNFLDTANESGGESSVNTVRSTGVSTSNNEAQNVRSRNNAAFASSDNNAVLKREHDDELAREEKSLYGYNGGFHNEMM